MKKAIIVVRGGEDTGKTKTIRKVYERLAATANFNTILSPTTTRTDFQAVLEYNGKLIGINSMGDPDNNLKGKLEFLAKQSYQCKVILTASRAALTEAKSETDADIEEIAKNYGYEIIWTSNYRDYVGGRPYHKVWLNELFAPGMAHLIQSIV